MQPIVMFRHRATLPLRKLIALIAAITLVPLVALLSLGSRLLDLDRKQENQRAQEHLEQSAQLVVAALQRAVSSSRQELAAGVENWAEGPVAISIHREQIKVFPQGRVAYLPVVPARREPPASILDPANEKEYQEHDPVGAIQLFDEHTKSPDLAVRAGALLAYRDSEATEFLKISAEAD